jgi:glutamate:GABA antiporter
LSQTAVDSAHPSGLKKALGTWDLILLFVVAVANLNVIPAIAASGAFTLWLWLLAFVCFFWPQGVAVTALSQCWPGEGGVYLWSKESFGDGHAFFAAWSYSVGNIFYLPTVLLTCVGIGVYGGGVRAHTLADSHWFAGTAAVVLMLLLLVANVFGLQAGKWVNNVGGIATVLGAAVVGLLAIATVRHNGSALHAADFSLQLVDWRILAAFGTICYSLVGLDIASMMGDEIRNPRRVLPRAILWGGLISGAVYVGATAALLVALPTNAIGILQGLLQGIYGMAAASGWSRIVPPLAFALSLAVLGTASSWFMGLARLPFVAGIDGHLPAAMGRVHARYGTPYISLTVSAVLSCIVIGVSFMGASVGEAYLTMLDLAVIFQLVAFAYLYAALLKVVITDPKGNRAYLFVNGALGLAATLAGIVLAFVPATRVQSLWIYESKLAAGCIVAFGVGLAFYRRGNKSQSP